MTPAGVSTVGTEPVQKDTRLGVSRCACPVAARHALPPKSQGLQAWRYADSFVTERFKRDMAAGFDASVHRAFGLSF